MHYTQYVVGPVELNEFQEKGTGKIVRIWKDIISKLPAELQAEAREVGFKLVDLPKEKSVYYGVYSISPKNPSPKLRAAYSALYNSIIYLKE